MESKRKIFTKLLIFIIIIFITRVLGLYTDLANTFFAKFSFLWTRFISSITTKFSFSIGDVIYAILFILLVVILSKLVYFIYKKSWIKFNQALSKLVLSLICFYLIFQISWGFNYYKTPIKEHYDVENISIDELKSLAHFYLDQSKKYRELVPENDLGVFVVHLNQNEIDFEIFKTSNYLKKIPELGISNVTSPNIKPSIFSEYIAYLGILGYYNPFTAEAIFIDGMPDSKLLFTQFHEVSHQWGFASESEANFVGFLIGNSSNQISFRYVSNYMVLRGLLNKIVWVDPYFVESTLECYSSKMKTDREYEMMINQKYSGSADDAFSILNEAYLQLNNQEGLESYGNFIELIVGFHRKYGNLIK